MFSSTTSMWSSHHFASSASISNLGTISFFNTKTLSLLSNSREHVVYFTSRYWTNGAAAHCPDDQEYPKARSMADNCPSRVTIDGFIAVVVGFIDEYLLDFVWHHSVAGAM